ncbi:transcription repressor OFP8-like [Rhododendron vialii]|uniref:transcription repressor OFP8-like n=1 Tax=Rhododendron vialii TaxID=182163 RepID=UPI00265EFBEC|nr:transcription repressor OFP8-like [Rhododendron vialii]
MDTQNPLKHRLSSMFRSSLGSCKSKTISDAISPPNRHPTHRKHHQLYQLFSPKPTFTSTQKPKKHSDEKNNPQAQLFPARPRVSDRNSLLLAPARSRNKNSHYFPSLESPPPPTSPVDTFFDFQKQKKSKKKRNKKRVHGLKRSDFESFDNYYDWFSSDDDDEDNDDRTTLFSSKSLSSDSSESFRRKKAAYRRRRASKRGSEAGSVRSEGKVKDGCVVVEKRSSDPYDDFTTSMVEMIVEKQIFGARDLEDLLETFLSLNSHHHHRVIVEVFTEICDALFPNWS